MESPARLSTKISVAARASLLNVSAATVACALTLAFLFTGCSTRHYRKSADRESYMIVGEAQSKVFGSTRDFTVDTPYSNRDLKDIKPEEIIGDRVTSSKRLLTLTDALALSASNSRQYQFRKETLYLTALSLSRERYEFSPQLFARSTGAIDRDANGDRTDSIRSKLGVDQLLKTGGRLGASVAHDIFRYYTGQPSREITTLLSVNFVQPLLRGAGASVVAEALTQAERDVVYEVRTFSRFQTTFAVDIVVAYVRLLQQRDAVRNEFDSYKNAISSRELSEALGFDGRISRVQVDQARQRELDSRNRYLLAVERYRDQLDSFKDTLSLPLGVGLQLEDKPLDALRSAGLPPVDLSDERGYAIAVEKRLDLLNQIDRFEDSKRKVTVAADRLKTDLNIFADASIESEGPTDYTKFDWNKYQTTAGIELDLPLDRLRERNTYRTTLISFERQLRTLGQELDNVRDEVRQGLRGLELARRTYEVQLRSVELANQRVEGANMLFQAGRVQIRDLLDAQDAQLRARNAFTAALVDYHVTRLGLLRDLGVLDVAENDFWLSDYADKLHKAGRPRPTAAPTQVAGAEAVVTPEELFNSE